MLMFIALVIIRNEESLHKFTSYSKNTTLHKHSNENFFYKII